MQESQKVSIYLVNHHDSQEVANSSEEYPIQVMLDAITDLSVENIKNHLANDKENHSESNVTKRPSILERVHHKNDLEDHIYEEEYAVKQVQHDEESNGLGWAQASPSFESAQ